jgi:hypothetical protein
LHVSFICSSAGEGGERMMTMMMIREAMTTPTVSNPVHPTHNNQPYQGVKEAMTKTTKRRAS